MIRQMRVAIIGQGYVGLTISIGALSAGHDVVGVDHSKAVVDGLNSGQSHIEGITNQDLAAGISSGKFIASNWYESARDADVVVIAVPTPLDGSGKPDLSLLKSAGESLSSVLSKSTLVINESTSHPGTLRELIKPLVDAGKNLGHRYAISPERVDPGNKSYGTRNTPRIVGGLDDRARDEAVAFYRTFCDAVVPVSSAEVAEAAKLFENTFRFINIGLVNEFAQIMGAMGIPADEVLDAAGTKPYGFMPFHPNVGIGGHCIPVDPLYLQARAADFGLSSKYIAVSEEINHAMPKFVVDRLSEEVGGLSGKKVLVVGVSYKAEIADTRETPAAPFINYLKQAGAKVWWHDPIVEQWNGEQSSPINGDYDLAVVLVAHSSLTMNEWKKGPIFSANANPQFPHWIPLISLRPNK
jgi:UDP-N-acetyl-D-glucosamine dehydrogenase